MSCKIKNVFRLILISLFALNNSAIAQISDDAIRRKIMESGYDEGAYSNINNNEGKAGGYLDRSRSQVVINTVIDPPSTNDNSDKSTQMFGKNIFSIGEISFAPSTSIATPKDYILAPGDELIIDIWGSTVDNICQKISPDGSIFVKDAGLINVVGLDIEKAEAKIRSALSKAYSSLSDEEPSTSMKLSLGELRTIKVNIIGEATVPGTYNLSSLSTLFNALYAAKGVNDIGSMRDIKVFRNNREIAKLDVYSFLMSGESSANIRLQDGDLIVISPYKKIVKVSGSVKRSMLFELDNNETVADLLKYAGGMTSDAYQDVISVNRRDGNMFKINNIDQKDFDKFIVNDGDSFIVKGTIKRFSNRVALTGAVWRPGYFELSDKVNGLKEIIEMAGGVRGDIFLERAHIYRYNNNLEREIIAFSVKDIVNGDVSNIVLQPDDSVHVSSIHDLQGAYTITVKGAVNGVKTRDISNNSGAYFDYNTDDNISGAERLSVDNFTYYKGMTLNDAILIAGGLNISAAESKIILTRRIVNPSATTQISELVKEFDFTVDKNLSLDNESAKFILEPYDMIYVYKSPVYKEQEIVRLEGEVVFPGDYVLKDRNVRLTDIIKEGGGFTVGSFVEGASLTRKKTESDIARERILIDMASNGRTGKDSLAYNIKSFVSVGINLDKALANPNGPENIVLMAGDVINVPKLINTVKISGGVLYPNTVVYSPKKGIKDYISSAGGLVARAKRKPYIIYMNGEVAAVKSLNSGGVKPGCEIVISVKPERRNKMGLSDIMGIATTSASMAAVAASIAR